jgi:NTP pyrophosphatase (non-canonical NTP hydrolase)
LILTKIAGLLERERENMNIDKTTRLIKLWAKDRNLLTADPIKQTLKLGEEFGELCQGLAKGNDELVIDSIGDMFVVLTILSEQLGVRIEDCVESAYLEIKDRKGKMINGVFVKESDLPK